MRVGILFSGGPAPAANAVIGAAVTSFLKAGWDVLGFYHGYSHLQAHDVEPLEQGVHFRRFAFADVQGLRNERGICIGTARANPGKGITSLEQLTDAARTERLAVVHRALRDLECDALISIGGDDTLKTANFLARFQDHLPADQRVRVVHLPKTIDNDYDGIDFTFGYFTAVDVMAKELLNLRADAKATSGYFMVETMGRKAGWLAYGVGIAGEASLVIGLEDLPSLIGDSDHLKLEVLADRVIDLILSRKSRGKHYGTVVLAEGLAEHLPPDFLAGVGRDEHGHISLGKVDLSKLLSSVVAARYLERTGQKKKITGVQLGYESRCAAPHAFDVMLGSQLGIGAYRALAEEGLDAHMVSVVGQLDLHYVPFDSLIDPETLKVRVRFIEPGSDFHQLARFLESRTSDDAEWAPGPRREG